VSVSPPQCILVMRWGLSHIASQTEREISFAQQFNSKIEDGRTHNSTTVKMRRGLVCFLIFLRCCLGQVTEIPRDQPLLQGTDVTTRCCLFLSDESQLLNCANQSAFQHLSSSNPSIVAVSYSTEGILDYGAYSMAINTYYSQLHGYGMNLLTPARGAQYEPRDQRWNKVKILIDALDPTTGWARDVEFIVWLDSDLIVLDMGFKLEEVIGENPSYDMIFSADGDIQNGIDFLSNISSLTLL
jgi:hypothetical protein